LHAFVPPCPCGRWTDERIYIGANRMKFILFVEGYTEDKALPQFLKKWLDPQLPNPVGIQTVRELLDKMLELTKKHIQRPTSQ
jgi:hypothetical protein